MAEGCEVSPRCSLAERRFVRRTQRSAPADSQGFVPSLFCFARRDLLGNVHTQGGTRFS